MRSIRFATEDGHSLQGDLRLPDGAPLGSAVIAHAHPRHGGSKDHPVLWAVRNDLVSRGLAVLAFNFRGTMGSGGTFGGGRTETRDVAAAIARVREESDGPTIVCGWSFGAGVALREALDDPRVSALALIGLPLDHDLDLPETPAPTELRLLRRPVLLLAGEHDRYAPRASLERVRDALPDAELSIVPGTDHYLWRRESEAAAIVGSFAERVLDRSS
jgi:alpha/beta superfamily hydrolase